MSKCQGLAGHSSKLAATMVLIGLVFCFAAQAGDSVFIMGIGGSRRDGPNAVQLMKALGAQSVREDAPWKFIETVPGKYTMPSWVEETVDGAVAAGVEPLLILGYGNPIYGNDKPRTPAEIEAFKKYAQFVVRYFKGRVRYFDLWNEWETHTGHTTPETPEAYIALAKVAYPAIKNANPEAIVLSGGIADLVSKEIESGWVSKFLDLGGLQYVDALSLHPYNQPKDESSPEAAMEIVDRIHTMALKKNNGKPVDLYLTEMGYPTYEGRLGISEDLAAEYLARFTLLAHARKYIKGVWWYTLWDQGEDPKNKEHHFGVYARNYRPKPAARMFSAVSSLVRGGRSTELMQDENGYEIRLDDGSNSRVIYWSSGKVMTRLLNGADQGRPLIELGMLGVPPRPPSGLRINFLDSK